MNTSDVILLVLPVMLFIALWLFRWFEQRLPEKQRAALDHFVAIAVKNVEQALENVTSNQKKDAAIRIVEQLFKAFKLPVPDTAVISAAIEAFVWGMNHGRL